MWGRVKKPQGIEESPVRERLASLLGLDLEEEEGVSSGDGQSRSDFEMQFLPGGPVSEPLATAKAGLEHIARDAKSAKPAAPDLAGSEALSISIGALAERVSRPGSETPARQLPGGEAQAAADVLAETAHPATTNGRQPEHAPNPENKSTDFSPERQRSIDEQRKLFQEQLAGIVSRTLCQSEATVHSSVSRLEAYFAQAKQIESTMDEKLANLSRNAVQAVQTQTKILEGELSKTVEQVSSQVTAALEPAANWLRTYRTQAEEINSALETSLVRFTQKAAEVALVRTRLFQENLATISDDAAQSLQTRMDEIVETSRGKLEEIQRQSEEFSAEFLDRTRTKSEAVVSEVQDRFKSDAEALEAKMLETVLGRLQKLTDEFRSMFDGAFA